MVFVAGRVHLTPTFQVVAYYGSICTVHERCLNTCLVFLVRVKNSGGFSNVVGASEGAQGSRKLPCPMSCSIM